jgi:hypothetical protein
VAVDGEEGIAASLTNIDEVVSRSRVEIHDWGLEDLGWGHWHVELLEVATTIGCHMMRFSFSDKISLRRERREEDEIQIFRGCTLVNAYHKMSQLTLCSKCGFWNIRIMGVSGNSWVQLYPSFSLRYTLRSFVRTMTR